MMQNRSFEWKGSELLLANVSSVLEFEFSPEVVDFARLCFCALLLGATVVSAEAGCFKDPRQRRNPLNDHII